MSTPRMPKHERRAQLLSIATEQFSTKGFQATSMDEIAHLAGATKPVVYQHFSSKEELYLAVVDARAQSMYETIDGFKDVGGDTRHRVETGMRAFHLHTNSGSSLRMFLADEQISDKVTARVEEALDTMSVKLAAVLTSFRQMDEEEARILGRCLIALAQTSALVLGEEESPARQDRVFDLIASFAEQGLRGYAPQPVGHGSIGSGAWRSASASSIPPVKS